MIDPAASTDKVRAIRRRRRRLRRRLRRAGEVLFLVAVVAILANVLFNNDAKPNAVPTTAASLKLGPAAADVKLGSCSYEAFAASAPVIITNHNTATLSYVITVEFMDGDATLAQGVATYDRLRGSRSVKIVASGVLMRGEPTNLTCKVADVTRFAR